MGAPSFPMDSAGGWGMPDGLAGAVPLAGNCAFTGGLGSPSDARGLMGAGADGSTGFAGAASFPTVSDIPFGLVTGFPSLSGARGFDGVCEGGVVEVEDEGAGVVSAGAGSDLGTTGSFAQAVATAKTPTQKDPVNARIPSSLTQVMRIHPQRQSTIDSVLSLAFRVLNRQAQI